MRILNAVVSAGLLISVVSCGDHSSSSSSRKPAIDQLITSADWKIVLEGRSFPNKAMVAVNDEVVVNECADKQSYFINREANPQVLPMDGYVVPTKNTVKIEVTDLGSDCGSDADDSSFLPATDKDYELTKDGAHAEVVVRL
jgi:hypothetical protein